MSVSCASTPSNPSEVLCPLQDVSISIQVPAPVVALQQQLLLPELPPSSSSSRGPGEPLAVQVVLQVPAGSSIPAANTAEVSGSLQAVLAVLSGSGRV